MSVPGEQTLPCSGEPLCDLCASSKALLYCRADSAKLCLNCDREAHLTNQLFQKHVRSLLCNGCNSAPSSIFCCTDSAVLCQNCDWEIHGKFRGPHDRRPIEGFSGCPSVTEFLSFVGLEDLTKKSLVLGGGSGSEDDDGWMDLLVWDTAPVLNLEDLIVPTNDYVESGLTFPAMGVPPLPKNRNAVCGKHKEDILSQLREMARSDPELDACFLLDPHPDPDPAAENQPQQLGTDSESFAEPTLPLPFFEISCSSEQCDAFSLIEVDEVADEIGVAAHVPSTPNSVQVVLLPKPELNTQERDSALSRYKEKKRNRKYEKQIRYESRKVRAEGRTRIKGRFAKIER